MGRKPAASCGARSALGETGIRVSPAIFGGVLVMGEKPDAAARIVAEAIEDGVNYFDVAPSYGDAETRLGQALAPYRAQVYLAGKTLERSAEGARDDLRRSLERLQTDHFDVYQLHAIASQEDIDQAFGDGGAMDTLLWAKCEGLIHHIGFSASSEALALQMLTMYPFETVLFPLNWALGVQTGWGDRLCALVKERGTGLIAQQTLSRRPPRPEAMASGASVWRTPSLVPVDPIAEQLTLAAMKYAFEKGAATLLSAGGMAQFRFFAARAAACQRRRLSDEEWQLLRQEAARFRERMII